MKKNLLVVTVGLLMPLLAEAGYICNDNEGNTTIQDLPCPDRKTSKTNIPIKANQLTDKNSIETVNRFYKALAERDPEAATNFLANSFAYEYKRRNNKSIYANRDKFSAHLHDVLSAVKKYESVLDCTISGRQVDAYTVSCSIKESAVIFKERGANISQETTTLILEGGIVKIGKMVTEEKRKE